MVSTFDEPGLLTSIWRDGRGLLTVMALGLLAAGGFAWTGQAAGPRSGDGRASGNIRR